MVPATLADFHTILFVHAHPDDETIDTGTLIAELSASGHDCCLVTGTRGEQGEVRPEAVRPGVDIVSLREREWDAACNVLGVTHRAFLGTPPARAEGLRQRLYSDSGMRWLDASETVAGPGEDAGPHALTSADASEIAADIAAAASAWGADCIVSYDALGGYGHPDHVALHGASEMAATHVGVPFIELVSQPRPGSRVEVDAAGAELVDLAPKRPIVKVALSFYASQLQVVGDEIVHVGGQPAPIESSVRLRRP